MKHITDEQLDALKRELQYRVNERGAFPKDLSRQLLTAIQTFRFEREAHQATRAELEQYQAAVKRWESKIDAVLDAARAGQGEGAE